MKILALETSGTGGSVAVGEEKRILHEICLPPDQKSARSLAPAIEQALAEVGWKPKHVELVAVTSGPGSFTGLRVGVVTAKAFAYAVGCPVAAIDTLCVLAHQGLPGEGRPIEVVLEAQRNDVFAARWIFRKFGDPQTFECLRPAQIMGSDAWLSGLSPGDTVNGPALERLAERVPPHVTVTARDKWQPMASMVLSLAFWSLHSKGSHWITDPFTVVPQYIRSTAAEEQWDKRNTQLT